MGDRLFPVAGPQVWNMLTATLHSVDNFFAPQNTLTYFVCAKRLSKARLFDCGCGM